MRCLQTEKTQSHVKFDLYENWRIGFLFEVVSEVYRVLSKGSYFVVNVGQFGRNDISFDLWKSAYRYLIDIDDVFEIIKFVLDKDCFHNEIINISSSVKIKVLDIINILENFNFY